MRYKDRAKHTGRGLHFKRESELHMSVSAEKLTRAACVTGEHATIKPPMQTFTILFMLGTWQYYVVILGVHLISFDTHNAKKHTYKYF